MKLKKLMAVVISMVLILNVFSQIPSIDIARAEVETYPYGYGIDINSAENRPQLISAKHDSWVISSGHSSSFTVGNVNLKLTCDTDESATMRSKVNRRTANAPEYENVLTVDGVEFEDTSTAGVLKLEISGLSEGKHTIATYHNHFGPETTVETASMDVSINGQLVADNVKAPTRVQDDLDALVLYNEVEVKAGETVEIIFKSNNDGTYNVPALNAIEIDKEHISKRIRYLYPDDGNSHFETDKGFSWTAAADTVSNDVYFGESYEAVLNADKNSKEYLGNTTANTYAAPEGLVQLTKYYWRVDGVFSDGTVCKGQVNEIEIATLAFPSAEGYGRFAKGGRGGRIVEVTNLNDSGPGSLRQALEVETGPRIVIFRVGGVIELKSRITIKGAEHGHVYVAGQTAPGDGITVIKHPLGMMSTEDVII